MITRSKTKQLVTPAKSAGKARSDLGAAGGPGRSTKMDTVSAGATVSPASHAAVNNPETPGASAAGGSGQSTKLDTVLAGTTVSPAPYVSKGSEGHETPRQRSTSSAEHINVVSPSNRSRVSSSRSSATIKALRLNEEAQLARRSLEREQQLFEREQSLVQLQREQEVARQRLDFEQNLVRLSGALRGQALEAVSSLLYTSERPEEVLHVLEQTFALPEMLVLHEIHLVRNLPKLSFDQKDITNFASRLRNCLAVIRNLDQIEHLYSVELLHSVISKLTPILYSQWKEFAYKSDRSVPKIQLLSEFLDIEAIKHNRFGLIPDYARKPGTVMPELGRRSGTFMPEVGRRFGTFMPEVGRQTSDFTSGLGRRSGGFISDSGRRPGNNYNNYTHKPTRSENVNVTSVSDSYSELCRYCNKKHELTDCQDFKSLTLDDKWIWLREAKICSKCLISKSHRWKTCKVGRCGVDGCERFHHPLLHSAATPHVVNTVGESSSPSSDVVEHKLPDNTINISNVTDDMSNTQTQVFLRVIPVEVSGPQGKYDTYALLDDGSMSTLIDWEVARHIGATGPMQSIKVDGACGMSAYKPIQHVSFSIKGKQCSETYTVNHAKAVESLSLFTQTVNQIDITKYSHLADLVDVLTISDATPKVLLGAEHWYLTINRELREGKQTDPIATRTALGWVFHGPQTKSSSLVKPVYFINHISQNEKGNGDTTMDELVKDYFRLDAIGISKSENTYSNEDKHALEILESTAKRLPSGRFEAGLLWRNNIPDIPDSYPHAFSRFQGLEKRMARDSKLKKDYCAFIDNMKSKGYAEECQKESYHNKINTIDTHKSLRWYLPHFPVIHPQKQKLRVVHDAAAKTSGVSLNSLLLPGPDLLQSLLYILFRFREGHVAMTADVKEMFPQIRIRQEDRDALRFIWRDDPRYELKEYRMTSVIFGAVCSPCTALFIKNRNAQELQTSYPAAAKAIIRDHYMDDYLGSLDSLHEAAQLAADIVTVHKAAGMEMRGWVSNIPAALASIPEDLRAPLPEDVQVGPEAFVRTLGLIWHPNSDTFSFRIGSPIPEQDKLTKRKVLSYLMCVYDPLGLLTPLVIQGRILFQQTWRTGIDWDTELQEDAIQKWQAWSQQLASTTSVKIPRWYRCGFQDEAIHDRQLHIFADASEEAYACVAYWRFTFANGSVKLSLIGGKARLSPLKPASIPRLELQASLIAARFANAICTGHDIKPDAIYFWSDSTTVLSWIRSDARTFKPFVANRVGEITEITNVSNWKYVPGGLNVADDATRLKDRDIDLSRWFSGPDFLLLPFSEWPKEPSTLETTPVLEELKSSKTHVGVINLDKPSSVLPDHSQFSEWLRFVRATARIFQCIDKFRSLLAHNDPNSKTKTNPSPRKLPPLSAEQMQKAEIAILRQTQTDLFGEEFALLRESKPLPKSSKLYPLCPVIDEDGLLRLDSRIKHMKNVDYATTSPIILDGRHPVVRLLIRHYHVQAAHAFNELVINELKQRFWILRCRSEVRMVARRCAYCIKRKARPHIPPTGDIPEVRLEHHKRPFTNTGLDYFGPVEVSIGRRREKRWIALFTCMTTRAVHLEIVASLSADSAIMSIRRFAARRGLPNKILSDNGTCFVGANRQLCEFYSNAVQDFAASKQIEWCYIPPASPFMGGCWERLVKTVKTALLVTLKERAPREELLHTLLLEAEGLINSRPLTYVTENKEIESLTPSHFLIGTSSPQQLPRVLEDGVFVAKKEWQKVLRLSEYFWSRWLKEYLPLLRPRRSDGRQYRNLEINDIVLVVDPDLPRGVWPLGRILQVFPGRDGIVRVADVATKGGILRRPARKLARLMCDDLV
ncbi:uncharacterized protein LOC125230827 isoform X2 [Leguminivora glycinivorella]|uniref:uncharacterized protein LOC125230827 isoform X2 n=1 Tax=Leguminivora glycinivorella TaxID=1035111 RepID=UPI00200C0FBB|nr:uncharacterized protein LOC125230827 isoform X2 [Leguminivora glycinivorella]